MRSTFLDMTDHAAELKCGVCAFVHCLRDARQKAITLTRHRVSIDLSQAAHRLPCMAVTVLSGAASLRCKLQRAPILRPIYRFLEARYSFFRCSDADGGP